VFGYWQIKDQFEFIYLSPDQVYIRLSVGGSGFTTWAGTYTFDNDIINLTYFSNSNVWPSKVKIIDENNILIDEESNGNWVPCVRSTPDRFDV
jgi:hypothetical protein